MKTDLQPKAGVGGVQDWGGVLRIGKPKAVGSNPTKIFISLFSVSLFFKKNLFFLFLLDHFILCREART